MKNKTNYIICFLLGCMLFSSCASEKDLYPANEDYTQTFSGINDKAWTYISFSRQGIVGTSTFGSTKEDAEWQKRTDWDLAICGKYLRTNSGSSGNGKGGLFKVDGASYETITTSVSADFKTDIKQ